MLRRLFKKCFRRNEGNPSPTPSISSSITLTPQEEISTQVSREEQYETVHEENPPPEEHVRLCPHETLSFERAQRIARMPGFRDSFKSIDAFTATAQPYHVQDSISWGKRLCKPNFYSSDGFNIVKGSSSYKCSTYDGLELEISWTMNFRDNTHLCSSAANLEIFLDNFNTWLCPHKKLSNEVIIHKICYLMEAPIDPVERYEAGVMEIDNCCCCSNVKVLAVMDKFCEVRVIRKFGDLQSAKDKRWLAQCAR